MNSALPCLNHAYYVSEMHEYVVKRIVVEIKEEKEQKLVSTQQVGQHLCRPSRNAI